jgi:hypothetical protein
MSKRLLPRVVFERPRTTARDLIHRKTPANTPHQERAMADKPEQKNGELAPNPYEGTWARWARNIDWRDKLHKKASHKALDIPEDDVIQSSNKEITNNGLGFKELIALGLLGLGGAYMITNNNNQQPTPPTQPPPVVAPDNDTDTISDVSFPK